MKTVFSVLWRLAALAATAILCIYAVRRCTGYYDPAPLVGLVEPDGIMHYVDSAAFGDQLQAEGYRYVKADSGSDIAGGIASLIEMNPQVIVICSDTPFTDESALQAAVEKGVTLLFVGAEPRQSILDGYDKAWALCNDAAHGGQLLGREAALAFRDGTIADANENLLLDCAVLLPQEYPSAGIIGREVLAESEHYGVYNNTSGIFSGSLDGLAAQLEETWPGEVSAETEEPEDEPEDSDEEEAPDASIPELIVCAGTQAAETAYVKANAMGWLEDDTPTRIAVLAESEENAKTLREKGVADFVAYYDRETATRILTAFTENALHHRFVAQDCEVQPDQEKQFIFAYKLWSDTQNASD